MKKSALSMHAKKCHIESFSLETFSISVLEKVSPQQLRGEEFRFTDKYRPASLGLKCLFNVPMFYRETYVAGHALIMGFEKLEKFL